MISVYFSPSHPIDFTAFETLISQLQPPFLVVGDFNCRHTLWGDSTTNSRGRSLERFLFTNNLIILNSDRPTHFDMRTQSFSCLDLSLCSPTLHLDFHWSVLDHFPYSDHFPILLSPTSYVPLPNPPRWCFDRADWHTFTSLSTIPIPPPPLPSISDMLHCFTTTILRAAYTAIPRTSRPYTSKCVPWWNSDCTKALRLKRAAWNSYRYKRGTPHQLSALISFKRASAHLRRTIKNSKTNSWQNYVSSITSSTSISAVWRRIHKLSGKHPPHPAPVLHIRDILISEPVEVANELGNYFSQVSSGSHLSPHFSSIKTIKERTPITFTLSSDESYNAPFSSSELNAALQSCRNTHEGPDGIHYRMLRHLPSSSLSFLLTIFNHIWTSGNFPSHWRDALILPFLKPNKSGTLPQDYRPIALTSCLCKLLERMVNFRLMWYLESHNLLSPSQFGFRRARSTADPLAHFETYITSAFARHESVLAIFFDLEKAYDTTWRYHILQQLSSLGLRGNMGVFIKSFLSKRTFQVKIASSTSSSFPQFEGVPQGSVLSTTLFLLAVNDIVSVLPPGARASLYVDDLTIYASGTSIPDLCQFLQSAITSVTSWATNHGFRFSTSKSFPILFSRSRTVPKPPLFLYNAPLQYRSSGKFLGVIFDSKLSWRDHILYIKEKAQRRLRILQTLSHISWGSDRKTLLHLHVTLILSTLDYGCHIYSSASTSLLAHLDTVHHSGLRLALGAFRSSPVESLYTESGMPSLSRRRALLSLRCYARFHQFSLTKLTIPQSLLHTFTSSPRLPTPLPVRMDTLLSHSPFPHLRPLPLSVHSIPPWLIPNPCICSSVFPDPPKSDIPPSILLTHFLDHVSIHSSSIHVYTDGSKSISGAGFAVTFPNCTFKYTLPPESSVLTTELYALLFALRRIYSSTSSSFTIFTDSRNSLTLIKSMHSTNPLVCKIQNWLFYLSTRHKSVRFCWVPSHVGIPGNEQADTLARYAAMSTSPQQRFSHIPATDYYPHFKTFLYTRWQSFWSRLHNNKLHTVKPSISSWSAPFHKNRRWETALARLRIGHTRLTHAYLMSRSDPPLCPLCNVPLSVPHILLSCPRFNTARTSAFPHLSSLHRPPNISDILTESHSFCLDNLFSFLRRINILHLI